MQRTPSKHVKYDEKLIARLARAIWAEVSSRESEVIPFPVEKVRKPNGKE